MTATAADKQRTVATISTIRARRRAGGLGMDAPAEGSITPDALLLELLATTVQMGGTDLHLTAGRPPSARHDGELVEFHGSTPLTLADIERMVMSVLDDHDRAELRRARQVDFSFSCDGLGRFRGNAYKQLHTSAMALRVVPNQIPSLQELGVPPVTSLLLDRPFGLVLVVGPTGSGKSTTLAAMIDRISATKRLHIMTIEDPVEYLYERKVALIHQREVGPDVNSFAEGLRGALREDPDVILLGEMRDLDSIAITLTLAETGHLVFATLHTNDAAQALDRLIDVFPSDRRDQIQIQLAGSLQGVISQRLLLANGGGRVAAFEVLIANPAIRNLIRDGKTRQLRNAMIAGQQDGMQTIEMDLGRLVASGMISQATAESASAYPKEIVVQAATARAQLQANTTLAAHQVPFGGGRAPASGGG